MRRAKGSPARLLFIIPLLALSTTQALPQTDRGGGLSPVRAVVVYSTYLGGAAGVRAENPQQITESPFDRIMRKTLFMR